jgi:hypothetical protein
MKSISIAVALLVSVSSILTLAEETVIPIDGEVPQGEETHSSFRSTFPPGTAEIEVRHDDLSSTNILDWGLDDPNGFRGWGGGNTEPAIVGVEAASRATSRVRFRKGTGRSWSARRRCASCQARYSVQIILRTEPTLAPQTERRPYALPPPIEVGARWYAGDFHVHSRESGDARPSLDEALTSRRATASTSSCSRAQHDEPALAIRRRSGRASANSS